MSQVPTAEQAHATRTIAGTIRPLDRLAVGSAAVEYCGHGKFIVVLPGGAMIQLKVLDRRRATFAVQCPPNTPVEIVKPTGLASAPSASRRPEPGTSLVNLGPGGDFVQEYEWQDLEDFNWLER